MRLQSRIIDIIIDATQKSFGNVNIYLFGSRLDDAKKGGDIDIAIDSNLSRIDFRRCKAKLVAQLIKVDFDFKIDIVNYNTKDQLLKNQINQNSQLLK